MNGVLVSVITAVYLNFGGENLPTNGLVNISQLGNSTETGLVCSTDQSVDGTPAGGGDEGGSERETLGHVQSTWHFRQVQVYIVRLHLRRLY